MKTLLIIIIVILIIYFLFFYNKRSTPQPYYTPETFDTGLTELDKYYLPGSHGVEDLVVDKLVCHPDCCGYSEPPGIDQWHSPFDGLSADQLKKSIAAKLNDGPFIRSSYTCANGVNGVGCPCFTSAAAANLANRSS